MKYTLKLNSGADIPLIGFGTWQMTGEEAYQAVSQALVAGYRHIDTATIYRNEEAVGRAITDSGISREELFITTKLWNDDHGDASSALTESLKKLGLDYVDLYLMHWPKLTRNHAWSQMIDLHKQGKASSIGVSNFTQKHLSELLAQTEVVPAVNQVEYSPFLNQLSLKGFCDEHNIVLEAYSPLTHAHKLDDERLTSIAKDYGKTPAQIMLRWAVQQGIVVIPKSSNAARIKENLTIFDFELTEDTMQQMHSWNEDARFCSDPTMMP